jgi:hypothetical protein
MTDVTPEIDFSSARRNDPCPCGSGKKFKNCHYKEFQVQREAQKQHVSLGSFVRPNQYPFQWLKGIQMLVNRRDWAVLHEVFEEGSPAHQAHPSAEDFVEKARDSVNFAPASGDFEVRRFHVVEEFAFIMGARGLEDRRARDIQWEVLALRNTPSGYRLTHLERVNLPKPDDATKPEDVPDPLFEDFACFRERNDAVKARPKKRPVVLRWDPATGKVLLPDGARDQSGKLAADGAMIHGAAPANDDDLAPARPVRYRPPPPPRRVLSLPPRPSDDA